MLKYETLRQMEHEGIKLRTRQPDQENFQGGGGWGGGAVVCSWLDEIVTTHCCISCTPKARGQTRAAIVEKLQLQHFFSWSEFMS